jgi:DNA-binding PadR family transcriptional regulator
MWRMSMSETIDALLFDVLAWLARDARPYAEVMDAWRTSCPRLPVWEDAVERGLVEHARSGRVRMVRITPAGRAFLAQRR